MNEYPIPADWLTFCEIENWQPTTDRYVCLDASADKIKLSDIEPPRRAPGVEPFKKYKLVPILLTFTSPECDLPAVKLEALPAGSPFKYRLTDGFHRFYASRAVRYLFIPAVVHKPSAP